MRNEGGFAGQTLSTATKRKPFPYKQLDEAEFKRCRRNWPQMLDGKYTYFMRDRRNGLIKIGRSGDPDERRARLSSSGYHDMEILLTLRDGHLEGCYHQHFADLRLHGEWFEPHPDILDEIERLTAAGEDNGYAPISLTPALQRSKGGE